MTGIVEDPTNWLKAFGALALMFWAFGRRDRYEQYHHDMARANGYELPRGQVRDIGVTDALWIVSLLLTPAAAVAGYMLAAPLLYGAAVFFCAVFVITSSTAWDSYKRDAARDGIQLYDAHGGRWGFLAVMIAIVGALAAAAVLWAWVAL